MAPTDIVGLDSEHRGNPLSFGRRWGPSSEGDRFGAVQWHVGLFGEIIDRHLLLVEEDVHGGDSRRHR